MTKREVIEDTPGAVRFSKSGDLEQLREVKVYDEQDQLVAVDQRWEPVPTATE